MGDAGFEEKIEDLKAQIEEVKQQYKQEMKDHKTTEGPLKESHLRLSMLEEEHQRCKWKLIAIKNGKDVDVEVNPNDDIVKAIATSTEAYKKH